MPSLSTQLVRVPPLTSARVHDLSRALRAAATSARVVAMIGEADDFCLGLDLEASSVDTDPGVGALAELLEEIESSPAIVVALVRGRALGGGAGLAAAADLVIAHEAASFSLPETLVGLIPAVIFPYVARRVGVTRARGLALTARSVSASEAAALGLADVVTDDLDGALAALAKRIHRTDAVAVREMKSLVAAHYGPPTRYASAARGAFEKLFTSERTQARIGRYRQGLAPWDPDDAHPEGVGP